MRHFHAALALIVGASLTGAVVLQAQTSASADIKDAKGQSIGRAELTDTPNGVLVKVTLTKAPAGEHAFHIHTTGKCEAPTFETAGGHFNPSSAEHGFMMAKGPHAGDLPNIHVPQSGALSFEFVADGTTLGAGANSLLDADGSALVMHAKPDDYKSQPSGAAGDRVACGIITK